MTVAGVTLIADGTSVEARTRTFVHAGGRVSTRFLPLYLKSLVLFIDLAFGGRVAERWIVWHAADIS